MSEQVLKLAVAVLRDSSGRMLVVRKKGTTAFMQPGGKIDAGETPVQALVRELGEELAVFLKPDDLTWIAQASASAANEANTVVEAEVFEAAQTEWPAFELTAEIEEARWLSHSDALPLAPLTQDKIVPLLKWSQ